MAVVERTENLGHVTIETTTSMVAEEVQMIMEDSQEEGEEEPGKRETAHGRETKITLIRSYGTNFDPLMDSNVDPMWPA